jgi:hypothetical protein
LAWSAGYTSGGTATYAVQCHAATCCEEYGADTNRASRSRTKSVNFFTAGITFSMVAKRYGRNRLSLAGTSVILLLARTRSFLSFQTNNTNFESHGVVRLSIVFAVVSTFSHLMVSVPWVFINAEDPK